MSIYYNFGNRSSIFVSLAFFRNLLFPLWHQHFSQGNGGQLGDQGDVAGEVAGGGSPLILYLWRHLLARFGIVPSKAWFQMFHVRIQTMLINIWLEQVLIELIGIRVHIVFFIKKALGFHVYFMS